MQPHDDSFGYVGLTTHRKILLNFCANFSGQKLQRTSALLTTTDGQTRCGMSSAQVMVMLLLGAWGA